MIRDHTILLAVVTLLLLSCSGNSPTNTPQPVPVTVGQMTVTIVGLPAGVVGKVKVTGPANFNKTIGSDTLFKDIPVGDYQVASSAVTDLNGDTLVGVPAKQPVRIEKGKTTKASVEYVYKNNSNVFGKLSVTITGLPINSLANVVVTYPSHGNTIQLTTSTVLDSLVPGDYTVVAHDVTGSNSKTYSGKPNSQTVTVTTGQTTSASVQYEEVPGTGNINIKMFYAPHYWGPNALTEGRYNDGSQMVTWNQRDSMGYQGNPPGYVVDGCSRIIGQKITGSSSLSSSHSASQNGSSSSGSLSIQVNDTNKQVTIDFSANASTTPIANDEKYEQGNGYAHVGIQNASGSTPGLALEIDNPNGDSINVIFQWSFTHSYSQNQDSPNWAITNVGIDAACIVVKNPFLCGDNSHKQRDILYLLNKNSPPQDDNGADTIVVTDVLSILSFEARAIARANHTGDVYGGKFRTGSATASIQGSLTITTEKRK